MKGIFIIFILLISHYSHSQNNDLNPNSRWNCWDLEGTSQCKDTYKYNLYFNGDSIINGNQYLKMYKVGYKYYSLPSGACTAINPYYHYFYALVRYHQKKLIYFNGSSDVTYIDYNLQIGDTIKNVDFSQFNLLKVTRIDSVNINGNYLNRFFYQCTTSTDSGYVIEKIGSYHGFMSEFTPWFESYKELICYSENDITVYNNTGIIHSSCNMALNLKSNDSAPVSIEVYPNPTHNTFTIDDRSNFQIKKIVIKNYLCQTISQFDSPLRNQTFDISTMENGIYFIEIETKEGILSRKIIKQ